MLDEQWYCRAHYPERSRYDTTVAAGELFCGVCHWNVPDLEWVGNESQWRCPAHMPGNEDKIAIRAEDGRTLYLIEGPLPPRTPPDPNLAVLQLAEALGLL